jgi:UDP-N-acetylglucosamine 2-epimerase (non-hydrolysing)
VVLGTRPEAIKLAPLVLELRRRSGVAVHLCITGQHLDIANSALKTFGVQADARLDTMRPGQTLTALSSAILTGVDRVLEEQKPDWVLVQGDTVTASMAALAAFYRSCRVGHVEAGLRTGDIRHPFPEEFNRRMVALVTARHFVPTDYARENLLRECVPDETVLVTGNTGIDALYYVEEQQRSLGKLVESNGSGPLRILVTAHRRENQQGGIVNICAAVRRICEKWKDGVEIIWPLHPNPLVEPVVRKHLRDIAQVTLHPPLAYVEMVREICRADLLVSDSGGIQEEAPALGKRVLVLRQKTERPEGVLAGVAELIGTDPEKVFHSIDSALRSRSGRVVNASPYGDGKASARIADSLLGLPVEEFVASCESLRGMATIRD